METVVEKKNFECMIPDENGEPCGDVRASKQGLTAHIVHGTLHGHGKGQIGFKIENDMWRMSSKEAKPSTYNPLWGKGVLGKNGTQKQGVGEASPERVKRKYTRRSSLSSQLVGHGTMQVPVLLEIDFSFQLPRISQNNVETQIIKVSNKKK